MHIINNIRTTYFKVKNEKISGSDNEMDICFKPSNIKQQKNIHFFSFSVVTVLSVLRFPVSGYPSIVVSIFKKNPVCNLPWWRLQKQINNFLPLHFQQQYIYCFCEFTTTCYLSTGTLRFPTILSMTWQMTHMPLLCYL